MVARTDEAVAVAGHHVGIGVFVHRYEGADAGELVPHLRLEREVFADLDAGNVRLDGIEVAPELLGGVGLEVVHVHVRRAARQVDEDNRLAPGGTAGGAGAKAEHFRQRDRRAERADL